MLKLIRDLLKKSRHPYKSSYIWTGTQSIMAALQSIVIMAVCTRTCGVEDAGIFAIGFAIANLMYYIGLFGVRRFQATDINEQYSFGDYNGARILSCFVMLLACVAYCVYGALFNDYDFKKFAVVMLICIFKCVMAYDDVYHGRMQQCENLHIAARIATIRYVICLGICVAGLYATHSLLYSMAIYTGIYIILTALMSANAVTEFGSLKPDFRWKVIRNILIACIPIFAGAFLSNFIGNASKYAIELYLNDTMQAYYGYVFMPAFAINLITNFIFNPMLTKYAKIWDSGNLQLFAIKVRRISLLVLGITVACVLLAFAIGIPVLSLVFGIDLTGYRAELCVAVAGGGMFAYSTYFMNIITIMREQGKILIAYIIVTAITLLLMKWFITEYMIMGGALLYSLSMTALALVLFIIMIVRMNYYRKKQAGEQEQCDQ